MMRQPKRTETVWDLVDARFGLAYWPWSLLAQPEPLPERILNQSIEGNSSALQRRSPRPWGRPRDIRCHPQTPVAPGADATVADSFDKVSANSLSQKCVDDR